MNVLLYGLQVTLVGMLVVFFGLIVLVAFIRVIRPMFARGEKRPPAPKPVKAAPQVAAAAPAASASQEGALIAVITAAIAAAMGAEKQFVVRNVRRVRSTPAWGRAGREEQIYSRM